MIPNFIQNYLKSSFDECNLIPWSMQPTKFYSITFKGWNKIIVVVDDETLHTILKIAKITLMAIVESYKDTHAFTEPQLSFMPDKETWELRIGTMENELYEKLMEKYKENETI